MTISTKFKIYDLVRKLEILLENGIEEIKVCDKYGSYSFHEVLRNIQDLYIECIANQKNDDIPFEEHLKTLKTTCEIKNGNTELLKELPIIGGKGML